MAMHITSGASQVPLCRHDTAHGWWIPSGVCVTLHVVCRLLFYRGWCLCYSVMIPSPWDSVLSTSHLPNYKVPCLTQLLGTDTPAICAQDTACIRGQLLIWGTHFVGFFAAFPSWSISSIFPNVCIGYGGAFQMADVSVRYGGSWSRCVSLTAPQRAVDRGSALPSV